MANDGKQKKVLDIVGVTSSYCFRAKKEDGETTIFMDYFLDLKFQNPIRTKWKYLTRTVSRFAKEKLSSTKRSLPMTAMRSNQDKRRRKLGDLDVSASKSQNSETGS